MAMRITLRRSGGFANIPLRRTVDTDGLPAGVAGELDRLLTQARLDERGRSAPDAADAFQYELIIDDGATTRTFHTDDVAMPSSWRPLVEWLIDWE